MFLKAVKLKNYGFIEGPPVPEWIAGPPFFISKYKFSWFKQPTGKIWMKIYCGFFFRRNDTNETISARFRQLTQQLHVGNP